MKRNINTNNKYILMIEKEFISLKKFNEINNLCNAINNHFNGINNLYNAIKYLNNGKK